uniref:Carboxypeptidase n=1 Tax=Leersia perrieri TaxID=77586 RepID=A0A0D9VYK7_9ORYZ
MAAAPCQRCRSPAALCRPFVLACPLIVILLSGAAAKVVTHLPGFDGPLPFYLETGYVSVETRGPLNYVVVPYNGSLPRLVSNPYSWTKMANFLYLDLPVGASFSYAHDPKGYDVGDQSSSLQAVTFLKKWFNDHPQYVSNPFYVGGSSYAGKLTPIIANYILEVGNPITGSSIEENFRVPYAHGVGIISDQLYQAALENCKGDYVNPANKICAEVLNAIKKLFSEVSQGHVLEDKCVRCVHIAPKPINDGSGNRFLPEEHIQLHRPPTRPVNNCFTYKYYLSYFWANYNATRDALGIREGAGHIAVEYVPKRGFAMAQRWIDDMPL